AEEIHRTPHTARKRATRKLAEAARPTLVDLVTGRCKQTAAAALKLLQDRAQETNEPPEESPRSAIERFKRAARWLIGPVLAGCSA
ncbi:hypothetical protein, partial [Klebsiella pneumoniae]|uniref:hypothetical protein n=1 Tax=Klebsiella pneumoniae TaxID=573 RepID=UPI00272F7FCE